MALQNGTVKSFNVVDTGGVCAKERRCFRKGNQKQVLIAVEEATH
jgi:predicted GTPase